MSQGWSARTTGSHRSHVWVAEVSGKRAAALGPSDPHCSSMYYGNWTGIQEPTEGIATATFLSLSPPNPSPQEQPPFPLLEQTLLLLESSTAIALDLSLGTYLGMIPSGCMCRTPALHSWLPPTPHDWGVSKGGSGALKTCGSRGGSNSLAQTP